MNIDLKWRKYMKKILSALLILISIFCLWPRTTLAEDKYTIYYKDKTCEISKPIEFADGIYMIDISEISDIFDIKYKFMNQFIKIYFGKSYGYYFVRSDISDMSNLPLYSYSFLPYNTRGKIYLPLGFFESYYKFTVKIDNSLNSIVFYDEIDTDNNSDSVFYNSVYNYYIDLNDKFYVNIGDSDYNSSGFPVSISYDNQHINATITCEKLNSESLMLMRDYFGDYESSDEDIFYKAVAYKESYIYAANDYYRIRYFFNTNLLPETNMKIISKYVENIYGIDSNVILYNIIKPYYDTSIEETHITINIPVYSNMCIYNLDFKIEKGNLYDDVLQNITNTINSIHIKGLNPQTKTLNLFNNTVALNTANIGIYPNIDTYGTNYTEYVNNNLGFSIKYPSEMVPYFQNEITDNYIYKSYKLDSYTQLSISARASQNCMNMITDKVDALRGAYKNVLVLDSGFMTLEDKSCVYIKYQIFPNNVTTNVIEYIVTNNSLLVDVQLQTTKDEQIDKTLEIINDMLSSLKFFMPDEPAEPETDENILGEICESEDKISDFNQTEINLYSDIEDNYITMEITAGGQDSPESDTSEITGYRFNYPEGWEIDKISSDYASHNLYELKHPDLSSPLSIYIYDSEIPDDLERSSVINALYEMSDSVYTALQLPVGYPAVCAFSDNAKYLTSSKEERDGTIYIYKLFTYLDDMNRSRLCSTIDIVTENHLYSILVAVSDYITEDGAIINPLLKEAVNQVYESFKLISDK